MSTSDPAPRIPGVEDQQPLLSDEGSLLRRVVTGLHPRRTWRRWFAADQPDECEQHATNSTSQQTAPCDIETGTLPVASAADEAAASARNAAAVCISVPSHAQLSDRATNSEAVGSSASSVSGSFPEITPANLAAVSSGHDSEDDESVPCTPVRSRAVERSNGSGSGSSALGVVATLGQLFGLSSPAKPELVGDTETGECEAEKHAPTGRALLRGLSRSNSGSLPMCLICLEPLTTADFTSGEAISLDCQCRGELALRHRSCAIKWSRVKGDVTCDICKAQVQNLPMPSPRTDSPSASDAGVNDDFADIHLPIGIEGVPGHADLMFDCIRVTWVAMIVCILFFEMNLTTALWAGIAAGLGYTLFVRAMVRNQLAAAAATAAEHNRASIGNSANATPAFLPTPMLHHAVS